MACWEDAVLNVGHTLWWLAQIEGLERRRTFVYLKAATATTPAVGIPSLMVEPTSGFCYGLKAMAPLGILQAFSTRLAQLWRSAAWTKPPLRSRQPLLDYTSHIT